MLNTIMTSVNKVLYSLLLICFVLAPAAAIAGTVTLAWDAPTTNTDGSPLTDLAGYKIYYGTTPSAYGAPIDAGQVTTYQINNLIDGATYYFTVTAYNAARIESGYSNQISKAVSSLSPYTLTTLTSGTGAGSITSAPAGITCGATCSATYTAGTTITLTAAANANSIFTGWSNACAGTGTCTVIMDAAKTATAAFALRTYTLSAAAGANGTISPAGAASVNSGATQAYTITPATGYHIADVLVDSVSVGAISSYTFTNVAANHTITASFAINTSSLAITASVIGNGSISPSGAVAVAGGANQTFSITPVFGYYTDSVVVDNVSVGGSTYTFTNVTANHTIVATFKGRYYTITPSAGAGGTISPSAAGLVVCGSNKTFTITPNAGYSIADVVVDGLSVGALSTYTFTNVSPKAHTISATFASKTYTITPTAGANGALSPSGAAAVIPGANQTVLIVPNAGYHVSDVLVDGVSVGAVTTYTFSAVAANHTITASFAINTVTITALAGANGTISPLGAVALNYGAGQTYTIMPATGYHVADVLVDGTSAGAVSAYTFANATANHTIAVSFVNNTYTINASVIGSGGSISPAGTLTVPYGGNGAFMVVPDAGYRIADVVVDNTSRGPVSSYTFSNISANHSITATFMLNTYTITAAVRGNGSISPTGPVSAIQGGNAVFSLQANAGNVLTDVLVDGASVGRVTSYTFTNIAANHTIEAVVTANLSCPDPGIPCVERVDGQADGNNLVNGAPKVDVEFEFRTIVADDRGTPQYVRLALARNADPVPADFTHIDMICSNDYSTGALCTHRTELAPAVQYTFYIEAMLSDGSLVTFSQGGSINGPQIALVTDATFTTALQPGWNSITSPYQENIGLSDVLVQKGAALPMPWLTAAANNWLNNDLYDFSGSVGGKTTLAEHGGSIPDAVLMPWRTYWVYLNKADDTYSLIFTKPLPKAAGQ